VIVLFLKQSHFDGCYTYFSAQRFSWGSTIQNWKTIKQWTEEDSMIFIPSVGPGYDDSRIRPWNTANKRSRNGDNYYREMFNHALDCSPSIISITTYNEWGEGTQIEPAVPFTTEKGEKLQDYGEKGPTFYMDVTREMVKEFRQAAAKRYEAQSTHSIDEL